MAALKPLLKEQAITAFNANYIKSLLFGSGEAGVLYVPVPQFDGQTLLFQDAAGTVPVTADGDPVGYLQDLSGNGNHATQGTSAARPIYPGLEYDGVDDALISEYPETDVLGDFTISAAFRLLDLDVSDGYFFALGNSSSNFQIFGINANSSAGITFVARKDDNTTWSPTGAPLDTEYHVATCVVGGGDIEFFVDGVSVASTQEAGSLTVNQVATGTLPRTTNVAHLNCDVAGGFCLSRAVTPSERNALEQYLAKLAGITL